MYVLAGGLISFIAWIVNKPALADWAGVGIAIQPNSAVASMLAGSALLLLVAGRLRAVATLGCIVLAIGAATLFEHATGWDLGIDTPLMFQRTWGQTGISEPGRIGMPGSLSWLFVGLAFMIGGFYRRDARALPILALLVSLIASISLVGFMFGADMLYALPKLTVIAPQTASFILALGIGLVAAVPEREPLRTLLENSGAGVLARQLFPILLLVPVTTGWLRTEGERLALFDSPFGTASRSLIELVLFSALMWRAIRAVSLREEAIRRQFAQFQTLLDNAPLGVYLVDRNLRIRAVNPVAAMVFGNTPNLIGRDFEEVLSLLRPTEHVQEVLAIFRRTLETGESHQTPERAERRLGHEESEYYEWRVDRIPLPEGGFGVVCYFRDISVVVKARLAIAESEQRFRALVTASSDVLYCMTPNWSQMRRLQDGRFISDSNETSFDWLSTYVHPDDHAVVTSAIQEAIRNKSIFQLEYRVLRKDGSVGWTVSRAVPIFDAAGQVTEWFGAATDVTERKVAEQALRDADRQKDEFLATLAHELRNPLAPIMNALHVMQRAQGDPVLIEQGRAMMERQAIHMARLVDDLLDVSRITRGKLELKTERVELALIIQQAIETCRTFLDNQKHDLVVKLPTEPVYLQGDPVRLTQVFGNILNNACKYTEPGGRIELEARRQGSDAVVTVTDSGLGISPDMLKKVFELFTQVDASIERAQGGLGIGLSLVKRLVDLHGGTVTASSRGLGHGSSFVVRLPVLIDASASATSKPKLDADVTGQRILVVDDNRDSATSLAMLLRLSGNTTELAHDGLEAVAKAESYRPEVILLDIGLPEMNGYDVCRTIRAQPKGKEIVIVALTGWGQDDDRRQSHEAGFDGHMVKPVDYGALLKMLSDFRKPVSQ